MVPARPCINVLNKSCETGHPCLAPVLWANIFNFSPFSGRQAAGLSNTCWGWDFCSFPPWLIETVDEEMTLTDDRFCGCGEDHTASVLHSANVSCQVCWFGNRKLLLHLLQVISTWSSWMVFLLCCCIQFANIGWEILCLYSSSLLACGFFGFAVPLFGTTVVLTTRLDLGTQAMAVN